MSSQLDAIKARAEAATDGPWLVDPHADSENGAGICNESDAVIGGGMEGNYPCSPVGVYEEADAEFIAHSRTDIPTLVAALDAVLAIHKPYTDDPYYCDYCSDEDGAAVEYPCPTVTAIQSALGEGEK